MDEIPMTAEGAGETAAQDEQLEEIIRQWNLDEQDAASLRSISRLLVGGALVGYDELLAHLRSWEDDTRQTIIQGESRPQTSRAAAPEAPTTVLRYAALGLFFESQDRWIKRGRAAVDLFGRTTDALLTPAFKRMSEEPRLRPTRHRFEKLVRRGAAVTDRWVRRGRVEEAYGRRLARTAGQEGFNSSMDQLGQAPALQDLIRKQSAGLTQDVLDEVRERTVTGDYVAEHVARSILRRVPRRYLPQAVLEDRRLEDE